MKNKSSAEPGSYVKSIKITCAARHLYPVPYFETYLILARMIRNRADTLHPSLYILVPSLAEVCPNVENFELCNRRLDMSDLLTDVYDQGYWQKLQSVRFPNLGYTKDSQKSYNTATLRTLCLKERLDNSFDSSRENVDNEEYLTLSRKLYRF